MALFLVQRLTALVITLLVASLLVFLVMEVLPGDPAAIILGVNARADTLAALRAEMGLDRPAAERYFVWLGGLVTGDLGRSYTYGVPVWELVGERIGLTLPLALMAIVLSTALAIPLGVLAAARRNKPADVGVMGFTQLGIAIPNFWFAMLLILLFAVHWQVLPAGGFAGWDAGFWPAVKTLILPAVALALPQAAILARVTRSSVLETLGEDFVRTARAKGLSRRAALWRHAVRNALIPVVTIMGLQFSFLLAGTIIIENVFYLPGLGRLIFQAIAQRDLIVVKDLVILLAASVVVVNFVVDLLYAVLDPRLRGGQHVV
ncbi:MAG TPA: ABC transporter permease [Kiloniellaceae bacterium]|nr:ABC transporter permease [Kiloniellaceae bacterium]HIP78023.1 ABC transporter permease [Kiloniellaceae bacterium]